MLVLFDHGTPSGIAPALVGHTVVEARERGWDKVSNGDLLNAAEAAGFQVLLTTDKNIQYQQNLTGRKISVLVLANSQWPIVRLHLGSIATAMQTHYRPLRVRKHQNGNLAASQVLLILDILVCREQYLEAGRLRGVQQITVRDLVPAALSRLNNSVPHKRWRDAARRAVVK